MEPIVINVWRLLRSSLLKSPPISLNGFDRGCFRVVPGGGIEVGIFLGGVCLSVPGMGILDIDLASDCFGPGTWGVDIGYCCLGLFGMCSNFAADSVRVFGTGFGAIVVDSVVSTVFVCGNACMHIGSGKRSGERVEMVSGSIPCG